MSNDRSPLSSASAEDVPDRNEVRALILKMMDEVFSQPEADRLEFLLRQSVTVQEWYAEEFEVIGGLWWDNRQAASQTVCENWQLVAVAGDNRSAIGEISTVPTDLKLTARPAKRWPSIAVVAAAALLFYGGFIILAWDLHPNANELGGSHPASKGFASDAVATLQATIDCYWSVDEKHYRALRDGELLTSGRVIQLESGSAEIRFHRGANVWLHGPSTFRIDSDNAGHLAIGKVTAHVPQQSQGFAIDTPSARIVDLGTEFGVQVDAQGRADIEVTRGEVEVEYDPTVHAQQDQTNSRPRRMRLQAGQALRALRTGTLVASVAKSVALRSQFFSSPPIARSDYLDLVDIVAGGDGAGSRRGRGIDTTTGAVLAFSPDKFARFSYLENDEVYHRATELPLVDGVFVPCANGKLTQIDSVGHRFEFPDASGLPFGPVWAGGAIPAKDGVGEYVEGIDTVLADGVDYAGPSRGLICMHTNKGITFDLTAMRQAHSQREILRFVARVGCSAKRLPESRHAEQTADFWVFVDGVSIVRHPLECFGKPAVLNVPLANDARFLTLATTDRGDISMDWVILGMPGLQLAPVEN